MIKEFLDFLKQYNVVGLAIAVVIGSKANDLVKAVVDNLIMPFVGILVPGGDWRTLAFELGGAKFGIGPMLGSALDFAIVAAVIFSFCKYALKEQTVTKK